MPKLYALSIFYKNSDEATLLGAAYRLGNFSFFQRQTIKEFLGFAGKTVVEHTPLDCRRQSIKQDEYVCHVLMRADKLGAVLISNMEYPKRVAHALITKVLDDFSIQVPSELWASATDSSLHLTMIDTYLTKYQDPSEVDAITKYQADLEEVKVIMKDSINAVLQRGVKLEDLIKTTESLSEDTRSFYLTTKETNSCCRYGLCSCFGSCCRSCFY